MEFNALIDVSNVTGLTQLLPMATQKPIESKRDYIKLAERIVAKSGGEMISFLWGVKSNSAIT
jgi:hypothetical protein